MKEQLLECLTSACPGVDFTQEDLVDEGILDSLSIMQVVAAMMDTFEIDIDADDVVIENFNSFEGMYNMLKQKKGV